MRQRVCIVDLDQPQNDLLAQRLQGPLSTYETLPRMLVRDGELWVESPSGFGMQPVSKVVFHGIFEHDHDFIAGLALWGGPCLPNARAMMDCRLKLPCLVRALRYTRFGLPQRGYASPKIEYTTAVERVAKWGNWHCGENKQRFDRVFESTESAIIEEYFEGEAVRVAVIGSQAWQIKLEGDEWLKSIHHSSACIVDADPDLVADTRNVAQGLGLEIAANDYIVSKDGQSHLLEVNHIPNVTRFPEIWNAYADYVVEWLS